MNRFFPLLLRLKIFLIKISLSLVLVGVHTALFLHHSERVLREFVYSDHRCVSIEVYKQNPPYSGDECLPIRFPGLILLGLMDFPSALFIGLVIEPTIEWSFPQMCYFKINRICDSLIPVLGTFQWWLTGRWLVWFLKRKGGVRVKPLSNWGKGAPGVAG